MNYELALIVLLFSVSLLLIWKNFKLSLYILLALSVLLHKEIFSVYRWDLLPVRIFMLAFLSYTIFVIATRLVKMPSIPALTQYVKESFINHFTVFLILLWIVRGISILYTKNLQASLFLYGFFTTVVALGIMLYKKLKGKPDEILKYIKTYIHIVFVLCLFGFIQFFIYYKYDVVIGALWNIPNNLPRIGSTFWDVNHFGALLATLLPVFGVLILTVGTWKKRITYGLMFVPMTGILFLTNSRTAWIISFVAFLAFVTILFIRKFRFRGILLMLAVIVLITIPLVREYSIKSSPFRARVKQYFHYRIDSFDSHFLLINGTVEIFETYPLVGGGYGGFFEQFTRTKVSAEYFSRDPAALNTRVPAHTIWGELIAETGILGLVFFVLFAGLNLLILLYLALVDKRKEVFLNSAAMFSAVLGVLIAGIFYSYNSEFFWLLLFLYFIYGISVFNGPISKVLYYFAGSNKLTVFVIGVLAATLLFWNLGANHLIPWDEAIYAKVAKNMVVTEDYTVLRWWPDRSWFEKPPLYMWFSAFLMGFMGFTSWAARIPSAIFGFGTVLLVYIWGKKLFNKTAGFISALALLTTFHFLYYSRASMLDVTATFFITLALYFYWLGTQTLHRKYYILGGLACGFAVMTKGVIGLLPFTVMFLYELYLVVVKKQTFSKPAVKHLASFALFSALVFLPWHLEMYRRFGNEFIAKYIGYHVLDRATNAIEDKGRPFLWYLEVIKVSMRIWFVALLGAFPFSLYHAVKKSQKHVFLILWSVFILLFFSIARSKLVWYIIPLYPVTALMVGTFSERLLNRFMEKFSRFNTITFKGFVLFTLVAFSLMYLFLNRELVYTSDLTGSQALLLQEKDVEFGAKTPVLIDRIEAPLLLYYTDGPFEVLEMPPLMLKLRFLSYQQDAVMITKESRYRTLLENFPQLVMIDSKKEWVLSHLPSRYDLDRKELKEIREDLVPAKNVYLEYINAGKPVPKDIQDAFDALQAQETLQLQKIETGLTAPPPVY